MVTGKGHRKVKLQCWKHISQPLRLGSQDNPSLSGSPHKIFLNAYYRIQSHFAWMCHFPPWAPRKVIQNSKQFSFKEAQVLTNIFLTLLEFLSVYVKWLLVLVLPEKLNWDHSLSYLLDFILIQLLWQGRHYDGMGRVLGSQLWGLGFCPLEICLLGVLVSFSANKMMPAILPAGTCFSAKHKWFLYTDNA